MSHRCPPAIRTSRESYRDASYAEDCRLTADLRHRLDEAAKGDAHKLQILFGALFLCGLALFLVNTPKAVTPLLAGFLMVVVLSIRVIVRINRKGDRVTAECPGCRQPMKREQWAGTEFHVCYDCRAYALGRDWS